MSYKKTYIDLFAGCGGLSLGLFNSGQWKGKFAIEKSPDAFKTLKQTTYWGVILIEINIKRLIDIKTKNRELYTMLSSQL